MLSFQALSLSITTALLSACASASGSFVPLGADHPASPQAPELPIQDPSGFLYSQGAETPASDAPARPDTGANEAPAGAYVCPMHADVTSAQPGRCPQCGMKLVPREKTEEHPHDG